MNTLKNSRGSTRVQPNSLSGRRGLTPRPRSIIAARVPYACVGCGCTDERGCPGGCYWVAEGVCSACVALAGRIAILLARKHR